MISLAAADIELLRAANVAHFVTLNEDGSPHAAPTWVDTREGFVLVNSVRGRVKDRNVHRDPRVAISLCDREDSDRWLAIRGTVVDMIEGDEADRHIDHLSQLYYGEPWETVEGQRRVIYRIRPDHVSRGVV